MEAVAEMLRERVADAAPRLRRMPEAEVAPRPGPERWSKKEILGHLIDSACNNHQRFVRALLEGETAFPGYEQEGWARCQDHASADWSLLVELWAAYNRHLAALIARFPPERLSAPCRIGGADAVTLAALAEDYVRHLDHHLAQLWRDAPA
jgi:hypothetical protein